ncbi:MAG: hypothetical protein AB8G18_10815 [Gammaproteobacteria bacterium]
MHATSEQLLDIRDGQPVDSDVLSHVELCEKCSHTLKLMQWNKQALVDLPQLAPSPQVFAQLSERLANEQNTKLSPTRREPLQWAAAAAIVAALALWLVPGDVNYEAPQVADSTEISRPELIVPAQARSTAATVEKLQPRVSPNEIALRDELLGRSSALEAVAAQLAELGTMRTSGSTNEALTALEAQLALVDYNLGAVQIDQYVPAELNVMLTRRVNTLENIVRVQRAELARQGYHGFQVMTASNIAEEQTW